MGSAVRKVWGVGIFVHLDNYDFSYLWLNKRAKGLSLGTIGINTLHSPYLYFPYGLSLAPPRHQLKAVDTTVLSSAALLSVRVVYFGLYLEQGLGLSRRSEAEPVLLEIRQTGTL